MADSDDKKRLSSVEIAKKTEKISKKEDEQIGVEADIPLESDEFQAEESNLSQGLKLNENVEPRREEKTDGEVPIQNRKVQVFNISSGQVVQRDLNPADRPRESSGEEQKVREKRIESPPPAIKRPSYSKSSIESKGQNKNKFLIIGVILLVVVLVFVVFRGSCSSQKEENLPPAINLTK